jgi:hypothetical protein
MVVVKFPCIRAGFVVTARLSAPITPVRSVTNCTPKSEERETEWPE